MRTLRDIVSTGGVSFGARVADESEDPTPARSGTPTSWR
jgi:hypothetical protein